MTCRVHLTVGPSLSLSEYCENISLYKQNYLLVMISIKRKVVPTYLSINPVHVLGPTRHFIVENSLYISGLR